MPCRFDSDPFRQNSRLLQGLETGILPLLGGIKMIGYQVPAYRPSRPQMGAMSSMSGTDWLLLLGGAVVGGAGINGLRNQFSGPEKANAISVLVDIVLTGVGLTLFIQKGSQAIA